MNKINMQKFENGKNVNDIIYILMFELYGRRKSISTDLN